MGFVWSNLFLNYLLGLAHRTLTFPFNDLRLSAETKDLSYYALYLLLFSSAESGDAFLFLATLRGALCVLSLDGVPQ